MSRVIIDNRSLAVTAPLLSRARQLAVFGPRVRLSVQVEKTSRDTTLAVAHR